VNSRWWPTTPSRPEDVLLPPTPTQIECQSRSNVCCEQSSCLTSELLPPFLTSPKSSILSLLPAPLPPAWIHPASLLIPPVARASDLHSQAFLLAPRRKRAPPALQPALFPVAVFSSPSDLAPVACACCVPVGATGKAGPFGRPASRVSRDLSFSSLDPEEVPPP